ncbi:vWA domain-containing protein [Butyrivibrio sp. AE3004]|uniref:vWA domain-containing protein n=1 Tax=Butyrivibrio sp. AE3004 TaxID=1506994 RepID=UPI00068B9F03|nr:VWA domain-containing protein [Butyrivibrio sp. AE3004]
MKRKTLLVLALVASITLTACAQPTVPENNQSVQEQGTEQDDKDTAQTGKKEEEKPAKSSSEMDKLVNNAGEAYEDYLKKGRSYEEADTAASAPGIINGISSLFGASKSCDSAAMATEAAVEESCEAACEDTYEEACVEEPGAFEEPVIWDTESYRKISESGFTSVSTQPFSTFGADTDTAVYSNLRRKILGHEYDWYGYGIDNDAIRIEEMVNYFKYDYKDPENGEKFGVTTTLNPCPWNEDTLLLKIGLKTEESTPEKGSNIVFLIDTSGSMYDFDKLPLVQEAFKVLTDGLDENDRVSIVTYAGSSEVVAEGVSGDKHSKIKDMIDRLEAGGSTNGSEGIITAYKIAENNFIEGGNNRVILATDGDLNVGTTSEAGLIELIEKERETGVMFSCLGFGTGNYQDDKMEALADHGNGNYAYIDCPDEAERVLKNELWSTIYTVAKDTKFQVEFNPETVEGYRLVGYENRKMAAEDFADDTKDGGEIGSNQCVTVLYEIVPAGSAMDMPKVQSKYQKNEKETSKDPSGELLTVNIRYKAPEASESVLREYPVTYDMLEETMDDDTSWACGVAQFGMLMRNSENKGTTTYDSVYNRLKGLSGVADNTAKLEFLYMVKKVGKDPSQYISDYQENVSCDNDVNTSNTDGYDDYYGIADEFTDGF